MDRPAVLGPDDIDDGDQHQQFGPKDQEGIAPGVADVGEDDEGEQCRRSGAQPAPLPEEPEAEGENDEDAE